MAKKGEAYYRYSYEELSAFCLQISLLLEAAVPLEEGLAIMAEDAASQGEKDMLLYMAEGVELGDPFFKVMEDTGVFPAYVVRMAKLGQQTGTMDQMMKSLSDYYEKEYRLLRAIKNAVTYPVMMVVMLLVVLFVLFSKVMPVFNKVYEQLGAQMPPVAASAMRLVKRRSPYCGGCAGPGIVRDLDSLQIRQTLCPGGALCEFCEGTQQDCPGSGQPAVYRCAGPDLKERYGAGKGYGPCKGAG